MDKLLDEHVAALKKELHAASAASPAELQQKARYLVDRMAICFQTSLLLRFGDSNIAKASATNVQQRRD